jgi:hypothetical protein
MCPEDLKCCPFGGKRAVGLATGLRGAKRGWPRSAPPPPPPATSAAAAAVQAVGMEKVSLVPTSDWGGGRNKGEEFGC